MGEAAPLTVAELCSELLASGSRVSLTATGRSMHPTIRDGEAIVVEPVPASALRRGEVAVVRTAGGITAHRFRRLAGAGQAMMVVCRGDNAAADDPPVPAEAVVGRVVAVRRRGRQVEVDSLGSLAARAGFRLRRLVAGSRVGRALMPLWRRWA